MQALKEEVQEVYRVYEFPEMNEMFEMMIIIHHSKSSALFCPYGEYMWIQSDFTIYGCWCPNLQSTCTLSEGA